MNFLVTFLFALLASATPKNPILPGWNPDPSIIRVESDYFIATSTFEYFPGHPIYHSKNLLNWALIGHGLNRQSQLPLFGTPSDAGAFPSSNLTKIRLSACRRMGTIAEISQWDILSGIDDSLRLYVYVHPIRAGVGRMIHEVHYLAAELRLFPRSFYVKTNDIFSNEWSDPIYFGKHLDWALVPFY